MYFLYPLFIIVPILELWLLITIGQSIGWLPTILLVLATAFIGINLLRQQGLNTLARIQQRMQQADLPVQEIAEGLLLFFAGGLLLTPGLITDTIGFTLLIPKTRRMIAGVASSYLKSKFQVVGSVKDFTGGSFESRQSQSSQSSRHAVIEGEFEEVDKSRNS